MSTNPLPSRGDVVLCRLEKTLVIQRIGVLSGNLMSQIDARLKATFELP